MEPRQFKTGKIGSVNYIMDPDGYTILSCHNDAMIPFVIDILNQNVDKYVHPFDKKSRIEITDAMTDAMKNRDDKEFTP